jgi:predicted RNA-binding Zn-ribbon protein involved in translation (DUF1610 family)
MFWKKMNILVKYINKNIFKDMLIVCTKCNEVIEAFGEYTVCENCGEVIFVVDNSKCSKHKKNNNID